MPEIFRVSRFMFRVSYPMDHWYRSVISGERAGAPSAILRFCLEVLSWFYAVAIGVRNLLFDARILKQTKLSVPVISVGNITTGGTGKTPTVIMLVKELQRMGRRPAVLTRGYGAPKLSDGTRGKSDEVMVIESECPGIPVIVNGDRVAGGREAIEKFNADILVIDDGFQHRRLARDLNIVLVDATEPLGIPGVLPRGTWREPPFNLKRANVIMLTRCEQVSPELANLAAGLLTQWVSPRSIFQQRTTVTGLYDAENHPVPLIAGGVGAGMGGGGVGGGAKGAGDTADRPHRVVVFAGIGNPNGFLHTVRSMGMEVVAGCWFDDHHRYRLPDDLDAIAKATELRHVDAWVTTLKDWVKLRNPQGVGKGRGEASGAEEVTGAEGGGMPLPGPGIWHVRIEARVAPHETELLRSRLATLPHPISPRATPPETPETAPPHPPPASEASPWPTP
jgi:tetraacyldisaccharide 4'-kinase